MIRLAIAVVLTITALIGLSLRLARESGTLWTTASPPPEVRTFDLGRALAEVIDPALESEEEVAERAPSASPAVEEEPAADARSVATSAVEPLVEEVEIVPAGARPFVEGDEPALEDDPPARTDSGSGGNAADDDPDLPTLVARGAGREVNQDEWAALIRRMLSVYRQAATDE